MDLKKDRMNNTDEERNVFRVSGVCFANGEEANVDAIMNELSSLTELAPALMTGLALARYMCYPDPVPQYLVERMERMDVGSTIIYNSFVITKWSNNLYNSKLK